MQPWDRKWGPAAHSGLFFTGKTGPEQQQQSTHSSPLGNLSIWFFFIFFVFFFFLLALIFVIGLINHIAGFNKQEDRSATIRRKSCKRFHHILWGWNKTLELFFLPLSHLNEYYSITATSVTSLFAHQNKGKVFGFFFIWVMEKRKKDQTLACSTSQEPETNRLLVWNETLSFSPPPLFSEKGFVFFLFNPRLC